MAQKKKIELDITMTFKDMYRFNLYHVYHSSQGILSLVVAVLLVLVSIVTWGERDIVYNVLYLLAAALLIVYVPVNLFGKVRKQSKNSAVYQQPIHYTFDKSGITTRFGEESVTMPWEQLYKIVSTRHMVLLYGGRIRANVIPRDQLKGNYLALYELAKAHMEGYRFKMKKE